MLALRTRLGRPLLVILAVTAVAGLLRLWDLSHPPDRVFDEVYYAKDGCLYAGHEPDRCGIESDDERYWLEVRGETSWVHPPLGKWAIALGQRIAGTDAFGWRVAAAAAGTVTVGLVAWMAYLLFGSALWAFVAGILLATESLHVVQSRVAMLDVFLALWVVVGFLFLLLDRRWIERRDASAAVTASTVTGDAGETRGPTPEVASPQLRPWRLAAGVALGAAIATKWSGLSAVAAGAVLALAWERTRRARAGHPRPTWGALKEESFGIVVALAVVPLLVYLASYGGWFLDHGLRPGEWWRLQADVAGYHLHLETIGEGGEPIHPYLSEAWTWLLMRRPVAYYYRELSEGGLRAEILGIGNPAVFWASLLALPYAAYAWWRRRDPRAGFVTVAALGQYLPWFLARRPLFLFYMTPIVPFLVLAVTYGLRHLAEFRIRVVSGDGDGKVVSRSRPFLPVAVAYVVVAIGLFVWFWPVLTGRPLPPSAPVIQGGGWSERIWFPDWI